MQLNFTFFIRKIYLTVLCLLLISGFTVSKVFSQTTITATGSGGFGWINGYVTFAVQNTNTFDIAITQVSSLPRTPGDITPQLWMSSTSLSGTPVPISSPNWTNVANGTTISPSSATVVPFITNIYIVIPAGETRRFALAGLSTTGGIGYSGSTTTPSSFSSGGVNLLRGNEIVAGSAVGYAGDFPTGGSQFTPRFFTGSITFVQSSNCTGTPVPGNTISSVTAACSGVNFNLSLQNSLNAAGFTYQWQSSPTGNIWTNISGATASTLSISHTVATYYRCIVTCSGNTGTSNPLLVSLAPPTACYCTPTYSSGCSFGDAITNVTMPGTTLNNTSTCSNPPFTYYNNVPAPTIFQGGTHTIKVTMGTDPNQHVRVWFDWNQDGDYSDPGESATASTASAGANGTATLSFTVPATASLGITRMRVRGGDDVAVPATASCGASSSAYGEAEDYNINIAPCVGGTFSTNPSAATVTCGGNATFNVAGLGSALSYTWQFRTGPNATWQELPDGGIVSQATTSSLLLTNVPDGWNGYEFRAIMRGACTGANPSAGAVLTVNRINPSTNISSANICSGSSQMLSLTNTVSAPSTVSFSSTSGLPLTVPDANLTGVTNSINVTGIPAGSVIKNVAIRFSMSHTWVGDLIMNLKAPNGQTMNLVGLLNGGSGSNGTSNFVNTTIDSLSTTPLSGAPAPRTGTFRADKLIFNPNVPAVTPNTTTSWLPLFGTPNGAWTIGMCDAGAGDIGILTAWSIEITYVAPVFAQGTWVANPSTPASMFTDAALTVPYGGTPATTIYVNPTSNTSYSVSFSTTTTPCVSASTIIPVSVGLPIANLSVPATVATCVGSGFSITATHDAVPSTNTAPIYQWQSSTDGGVTWVSLTTPSATTRTLVVASTTQTMNGTRYRILSRSGSCAIAVSGNTTLVVNALPVVTLAAPTVSLTPGRTTTITGTSSPAAAAWTWSLNGNTIAGTSNTQTVNIDGLGNYVATVRDINGCVNRSNVLSISAEASDKLWIYPNPTSGVFQIRYYHAGDMNEKRIISVYNANGQLVATQTFNLTFTSAPYLRMDVDLSGSARGTYVVKVAHEYSGKIVSGLVLVQ